MLALADLFAVQPRRTTHQPFLSTSTGHRVVQMVLASTEDPQFHPVADAHAAAGADAAAGARAGAMSCDVTLRHLTTRTKMART
jgi:hypothetical protein